MKNNSSLMPEIFKRYSDVEENLMFIRDLGIEDILFNREQTR